MSRRIAYGALAAAFVLIAGPAQADRECFENSCRMPDVVEPPPSPPPAAAEASAAEKVEAGPGTAAAPKSEAAHALGSNAAKVPAGVYPQMVVDPAPRKPVKQAQPAQPAPRRDANANLDVGPARFPPRPVPRYPSAVPVASTSAASAARSATPLPARAPAYAAGAVIDGPASTEAVVARTPRIARVIHVEPGVAPAYAIMQPDPAWKRCQIDQRELVGQHYRCGPHSYHPYGAYGYRPYGSYRSYRSDPGYVLAPNAKIISIDSGD